MTRIRSIAEAHHAVFAATRATPMPTTASSMAVGAITAMRSIGAREAAQPVPPVTLNTLTILTPMASGQA